MNDEYFSFKVTAKSSECFARTGVFFTPHGKIETPIFMPVGTRASVKGLAPEEVADAGAQIILANTYHCFLRPGADIVAQAGGLHKFMNWHGPILTDSGGFQVFSLENLRKLDDDGVSFKSHIDGKIFKFTPESNMEVQNKLGADIIMQLDICSPYGATREDVVAADARTVEWLKRCYNAHKNPKQSLFPIVQGNFYKDLRLKSLENALPYAKHGIAVGGLAIGEPFTVLKEQLENLAPHLPMDLPHYLMGAGTPDYILEGVENGIDMFDCVLPTRNARHGSFFTWEGKKNIKVKAFEDDASPLVEGCNCFACRNHSKAYIRHLWRCGESTAATLLSIHNIQFLVEFSQKCREAILEDRFGDFFNEHYCKLT